LSCVVYPTLLGVPIHDLLAFTSLVSQISPHFLKEKLIGSSEKSETLRRLFLGQYKETIKSKEFNIFVPPVNVELPGRDIVLEPSLANGVIEYSAPPPN